MGLFKAGDGALYLKTKSNFFSMGIQSTYQ